MKKKVQRIILINFYLIALLTQVPPIYLLGVKSSLLASHGLARGLIIINFLLIYLLNKIKKGKNSVAMLLILILFLIQSLSVIYAKNINFFLQSYKDIAICLVYYFSLVFGLNQKNKRKILYLLIFIGVLNSAFEFLLYFHPQMVFGYLKPLIHEAYWDYLTIQYNRGRFFGMNITEFLIPIFVYFFLKRKDLFDKISNLLFIMIIGLFSILSNWRTKFIVFLITLFLSVFIFTKNKTKIVVFLLLIIIIPLFIVGADKLGKEITGSSTIDRIFFSSKTDNQAILSRFVFWKEGTDIWFSSPLIGVGLGNYYDNSLVLKKNNQNNSKKILLIDSPHNIFVSTLVESGIFGFIMLLLIIMSFIKSDIFTLKTGNKIEKIFIIGFWSIFLFSVTWPHDYFYYLSLFWGTRGIIDAKD